MPLQTARIFPGSDYSFDFGGEATVAWSTVPVASIVDDPPGAPDGVAGQFPAAVAATRTAYAEYRPGSIPSGILSISAVRAYARFLAKGTAGFWDLEVSGIVRPSGTGNGSTGAYFGTPVTITSESADGEVYHDALIGNWTVDPATTVVWTAATLRAFVFGARFEAPATSPAVNASSKFDGIYLELDYVTIAADIDGVRAVASSFLRLFRREPDLVEITGPMLLGDVDNLETFGLEHPDGPAPDDIGWGPELWRRGLPIVLERTLDMIGNTVRTLCFNPRQYLTRWWSTFLTDVGHSLDGQGIPLLHSGAGGIQVTRGSSGYLERPGAPPDGLIMAAGEDLPKYDRRGLMVEGAGATNSVLNSTFSQGAGNAFTDWATFADGTGVVEQSLTLYQFDEEGLRRSVRLFCGAGDSANAYVSQGMSASSFRARVRAYNNFGAGKLGVKIKRSSDNFFLEDDMVTWVAGPVTAIRMANDAGWFDWRSDLIDVGGADTVTMYVGYFGEAGTIGFEAFATSVELYDGSPTHIGSDLPTTTVPVTRTEDVIIIDNPEVGRMWEPTSGSFVLGVTPLWGGDDIAEDQEKMFWYCLNTGEGGAEEILYRRGVGDDPNLIIFRRNDEEAAKEFTPVAGVRFKISVRWVATAGELGLPEYTHEVAVNDVWGTPGAIGGAMPIETTAKVYVGSDGDTKWADAALCDPDVSPLVLLDDELARRAP